MEKMFGGLTPKPEADPRVLEIARLEEEIAELSKTPEDERDEADRSALTFKQNQLHLLKLALEEEK